SELSLSEFVASSPEQLTATAAIHARRHTRRAAASLNTSTPDHIDSASERVGWWTTAVSRTLTTGDRERGTGAGRTVPCPLSPMPCPLLRNPAPQHGLDR